MSRLETVKSKYPDINWEKAAILDPSSNHKYLDWIGNNIDKLKIKQANYPQIKEALIIFEKKKDKLKEKNIANYNFKSLQEALKNLGASRKEIKLAGSVDLGTIDEAKVVFLESYEAAKLFFANTKWCISQKSHFKSYCKDNNIFRSNS